MCSHESSLWSDNLTDLIKENMLCNNYTITAKHLQFFLSMKFKFTSGSLHTLLIFPNLLQFQLLFFLFAATY